MKVEKQNTFVPIVITLTSQDEVDALQTVVSHPMVKDCLTSLADLSDRLSHLTDKPTANGMWLLYNNYLRKFYDNDDDI